MDDAMDLSLIRVWCEVLEDANPLYHDLDYALRSRHGGIVAPPAMIMPLCMRPEWSPRGAAPTTGAALRSMLPEFPNIASLSSTQHYFRPIRLGERPTIHYFESEPSPERITHRGPGRVMSQTYSFRDEDGAEIARHHIEVLRSRASVTQSVEDVSADLDDVAPGASRGGGRRSAGDEPLSWDDVDEGDVLPQLVMAVTLTRCIKWVAATRDFFDVHHDRDMARSAGEPDLFIGVHFFKGLACRHVTDWSGPDGDLRRLYLRTFGRAYPGDVVEISGRVARKFVDVGEACVDIAITCTSSGRRTHDGVVTAVLPRR